MWSVGKRPEEFALKNQIYVDFSSDFLLKTGYCIKKQFLKIWCDKVLQISHNSRKEAASAIFFLFIISFW